MEIIVKYENSFKAALFDNNENNNTNEIFTIYGGKGYKCSDN